MSANPHANGGLLLRDLALPDFRDYAVEVSRPGRQRARAHRGCSASWLRDVIAANPTTFRVMGPDETASNRLQARVRGDRTAPGWPRPWPATTTSPPTAG